MEPIDNARPTMEFVAHIKNLEYTLFTSDGTFPDSDGNTLHGFQLLQPFRGLVWAGVLVSGLATALITAKLQYPEKLNLRKFFTALYSAMSTPVGQTQHFPLGMQREIVSAEQKVKAMGQKKIVIIWSLWLLSSVFITNNYGAMFSSNYMLEPVYTRNWTAGLLEMDDFTMFIGFDKPPLKSVQDQLVDSYYSGNSL